MTAQRSIAPNLVQQQTQSLTGAGGGAGVGGGGGVSVGGGGFGGIGGVGQTGHMHPALVGGGTGTAGIIGGGGVGGGIGGIGGGQTNASGTGGIGVGGGGGTTGTQRKRGNAIKIIDPNTLTEIVIPPTHTQSTSSRPVSVAHPLSLFSLSIFQLPGY